MPVVKRPPLAAVIVERRSQIPRKTGDGAPAEDPRPMHVPGCCNAVAVCDGVTVPAVPVGALVVRAAVTVTGRGTAVGAAVPRGCGVAIALAPQAVRMAKPSAKPSTFTYRRRLHITPRGPIRCPRRDPTPLDQPRGRCRQARC